MHIQAGDRLIDGAFDTRRPGFVAASHGTLRLCHDTECACRCRKHLPPGIGREGSFSSGVPSIDPASDACSLLTYCLVAVLTARRMFTALQLAHAPCRLEDEHGVERWSSLCSGQRQDHCRDDAGGLDGESALEGESLSGQFTRSCIDSGRLTAGHPKWQHVKSGCMDSGTFARCTSRRVAS